MSSTSRITVRTEHPIAADSLDHLQPRGTALDNSRNHRFNWKLYALFGDREQPLRVLDLGCAGGGFVRDCLYDGRFAVGIEGSDYSARLGRAEWPVLGGRHLFTADITKPFHVCSEQAGPSGRLQFDVVTLWGGFEHIAEADLPSAFANVCGHLSPGGLVIASISDEALPHHQTRRDRAWWMDRFRDAGLTPVESYGSYFAGQYIRGPRYNAPGSFHVIASNDVARAPRAPRLTMTSRMLDRWWYGTRPYHKLRHLLGIEP